MKLMNADAEVREAEAQTLTQRKAKVIGHFEEMKRHGVCMLKEAVEIGLELEAIKGMIADGNWQAWARASLPFGVRQASRYMRVARKAAELHQRDLFTNLATCMSVPEFERWLKELAQDEEPKGDSDKKPRKATAQSSAQTPFQKAKAHFNSLYLGIADLGEKTDPDEAKAIRAELKKVWGRIEDLQRRAG